jgi:hypothetical protein
MPDRIRCWRMARLAKAGRIELIISSSIQHGTEQTYTLRRLARDNPELLDRVASGELSANGAAVLAGFRRPMKSVPIDSPCSAVRALLRVFSAEDLAKALAEERV